MQKNQNNPKPMRSQVKAIFPMATDAYAPVALSPPFDGRLSLWRDGTRSLWVANDPASLGALHDGSFAPARTTNALFDTHTGSLLLIALDTVVPTAVAQELELSYVTLELAGRLESDTDRSIATPSDWKDFASWLARMLDDALAHEMILRISLCEDDGAARLVTQSFMGASNDTFEVELTWSSASDGQHLGHQSAHPLEEADIAIARVSRLLTETFQEFAPSPLQLRFGFTSPSLEPIIQDAEEVTS